MTKKILIVLFVVLVFAFIFIFRSKTTPIEIPETTDIPQILSKAISSEVNEVPPPYLSIPSTLKGVVLTGNSSDRRCCINSYG